MTPCSIIKQEIGDRSAKIFVLCIIPSSRYRGIAKLVKAPDSDSGIRGFESFFPCQFAEFLLQGNRQAG